MQITYLINLCYLFYKRYFQIMKFYTSLFTIVVFSILFPIATQAQRPNGFQKVVPQNAGRVDSLEDFIQLIGSNEIITGGKALEVKYKRALHISMNGKRYKRSEVLAFQNRKGYFKRFKLGERRGKIQYTRTMMQRLNKEGNIHEYKNVLPDASDNDPMRGKGGTSLLQYTYYRWFHIIDSNTFGSSQNKKFLRVMMKDCAACLKKLNMSRVRALRMFFEEK